MENPKSSCSCLYSKKPGLGETEEQLKVNEQLEEMLGQLRSERKELFQLRKETVEITKIFEHFLNGLVPLIYTDCQIDELKIYIENEVPILVTGNGTKIRLDSYLGHINTYIYTKQIENKKKKPNGKIHNKKR